MNYSRIMSGAVSLLGFAIPAYSADFTALTPVATGQRPAGVVSGDFDADGIIDLAVASDNLDKVQVFLGTGNGTFGTVRTIFTGAGTGANGLSIGDFDNDGDSDIAVTLKNTNQVRILVNAGAANFTLGATSATGAEPIGVSAGDINQDGNVDLCSVNRSGNNVTVMIGNGSGGFTATNVSVGADPRAVAIGNIDGDNDLDLVVTNHDDRSISILRNVAGVFVRTDMSVGSNVRPSGIVFGDINLDGDLDIAVATSGNGFNLLATFSNDGSGAFSGPVNFIIGGADGDPIVLGDFDGDADLDAAIGNQSSNNISTITNNGAGSFGGLQLHTAGQNPSNLSLGDINGDGKLDLALSNRDSNTVSLFSNAMGVTRSAATAVAVAEGSLFSGNLASLSRVDSNEFLTFNSEVSLQAGVDVSFKIPLQTPSALGLEAVTAVDRSGISRAFYLYDWTSQIYREIGGSTETTALTTKVSHRRNTAHRFVNANREVRARIQWAPINDEDPSQDGWLHHLDYVNLQVTP